MVDKKISSGVSLSLNNQADIQVKTEKRKVLSKSKSKKYYINKYLYDVDGFALLSSN